MVSSNYEINMRGQFGFLWFARRSICNKVEFQFYVSEVFSLL